MCRFISLFLSQRFSSLSSVFFPHREAPVLAETLFVLILSGFVPVSVLGIAVIMWRLFLYYITAGIGMVISFRYLFRIRAS